jgi:hypothetical protein
VRCGRGVVDFWFLVRHRLLLLWSLRLLD